MISKSQHKKALFKCDVTGLTGVYVGQKEATSLNSNKELRQIVYIPLKDVNEGMRERWKGVTEYEKLWEVTNTKYPKKAIIGPKTINDANLEEGLFDTQVVATQDKNGRAPFRESFVGDEIEQRIDRLEADLREAQKDSGLKDVENLDNDNEDDKDYKRDGRGRNRFDELNPSEFRR